MASPSSRTSACTAWATTASTDSGVGVPVWEEPVRGSFGDPSLLALPGVERMRRSVRGLTGTPPIYHLTGLKPTEADIGTSTFAMPVSPWLQTTVPGLIPGGMIAFLADGPLGTAIMTVLPPLGYMTTSDLSMSFIRPGTLDGGPLTGRARVIHHGKTVGLSEVTVEDELGRQLAHGTSRGFVLNAPDAPPAAEPGPPVEYSTTDPYLRRPVEGRPFPQEDWDRMSGLQALRRCVSDRDAAPPIYHLMGLRPIEALEGRCSFVIPATGWLMPPAPHVYGGAIALLADAALSGAVLTICPLGGSFATLDLKVNFLRPVLPDGGLLTALATLAHRGRTMVVATAELFNEEGKRIAIASSSAMLLPDRRWSALVNMADQEAASTHRRTRSSRGSEPEESRDEDPLHL